MCNFNTYCLYLFKYLFIDYLFEYLYLLNIYLFEYLFVNIFILCSSFEYYQLIDRWHSTAVSRMKREVSVENFKSRTRRVQHVEPRN